ncbi:hypothetical protein ACG2DA_20280, partial [Alienimonas sp. DA493]
MVARPARLSAVRPTASGLPAAGLSAVRARRRPVPPRPTAGAEDDGFAAAAGAARILVGVPPAEPAPVEPVPVEPPSRGLSGANWLSGPA